MENEETEDKIELLQEIVDHNDKEKLVEAFEDFPTAVVV